jgi:hypothetical protein
LILTVHEPVKETDLLALSAAPVAVTVASVKASASAIRLPTILLLKRMALLLS